MSEPQTALEVMRAAIAVSGPPHGMWNHMGMRMIRADEGSTTVRIEIGEHLANINGIVHGGVYATLLDSTLGSTVHTVLPLAARLATVDLTVSYLRSASLEVGELFGVGTVTRRGRRICHASGEVVDAEGKVYATAVGSFLVTQPDA